MTRSFPPPESQLHHRHFTSVSPGCFFSSFFLPPPPSRPHRRFLLLSLPPFSPLTPLFLLVFANAIPRNEPALGPSCPPIIILTGFNLNNAACGFHRHARPGLIISRTNSPTRYPLMVHHLTSLATIIFSLPPRITRIFLVSLRDRRSTLYGFLFALLSRCSPASSHRADRYNIPEFIPAALDRKSVV